MELRFVNRESDFLVFETSDGEKMFLKLIPKRLFSGLNFSGSENMPQLVLTGINKY